MKEGTGKRCFEEHIRKQDLEILCLSLPAQAGDPSLKGALQPHALAPGCSNVSMSVMEGETIL